MLTRSIAHAVARSAFRLTNRALKSFGLVLSRPAVIHGSPAFSGATTWSHRLWEFEAALELIDGVEGDIVESGVHWGYGILAWLHATRGSGRHIYGFDSFEGHSAPQGQDRVGGRFLALGSSFAITEDDAWRTLELGTGMNREALAERVTLVPGWMQETMPAFAADASRPIALAHVDPDLYEPVKATLDALWPLLAPGGLMFVGRIDNPELPGKARAVREFMAAEPGCEVVTRDMLDTTGVTQHGTYLRKPVALSSLRAA